MKAMAWTMAKEEGVLRRPDDMLEATACSLWVHVAYHGRYGQYYPWVTGRDHFSI